MAHSKGRKCRYCKRYSVFVIEPSNASNISGHYCMNCQRGYMNGERVGQGWIKGISHD